nr:hypothetical protein [Tanacetum cinerariifolium]
MPVLKTAFPMAWRILFTFVVQVLARNYSSTEQVNLIQQLFAYCLLTRTKVDIGEIIYSDLVTRLTNMSWKKYISYPRFISCALEVLLGLDYTQDESFRSSPTILSNSKVTPIELTAFMVDPVDNGLPSTDFDQGMAKTTPFLEGSRGDKDLEGLKPHADMEPQTNHVANPSWTGAKYQWMKPNIQAYLLSKDKLAQESDEKEVFTAREDMKEDTQADEEEHESLSPKNTSLNHLLLQKLKKVSRVLFKKLMEGQWAQHKEVVVSYADLEASIEGYYEENVTETLKAIQDAVKEDLVLNKKVIEATEAELRNEISSLKQDTSDIKSMMIKIYQDFKVTSMVIEEPPSYTERETDDMETKEPKDKVKKEQDPKRLTRVIPISVVKPLMIPNPELEMISSSSTIKHTNTPLKFKFINLLPTAGRPPPPPPPAAAGKLFRRAFFGEPKKTPRLPIYPILHTTLPYAPPPLQSPPQPPPIHHTTPLPPPPLASVTPSP